MNIFELVVLGLALSMDSFACSVSKGIEIKKLNWHKMLVVAIWFAIFQSMMPVIGYYLVSVTKSLLFNLDHWLSFFVLVYLGVSMIKSRNDQEELDEKLDFKTMALLSTAISIDAFTVGITYSALDVDLLLTIIVNFSITFITTLLGVKLGNMFGNILNDSAKLIAGLVLIALGIKFVLAHLNILCF